MPKLFKLVSLSQQQRQTLSSPADALAYIFDFKYKINLL